MLLIDDSWAFAFALVGAIGSVATAVAVIFLWIQSRQTQTQIQLTQEQTKLTREEMESTLRPWIGFSEIRRKSKEEVVFYLKNYGRIPAKIVRTRNKFGKTKIGKDELLLQKGKVFETMVFPDATMTFSIQIPEQFGFVSILFEYEYANKKHGEYGVIAKHHAENNTFDYYEVFAN